MSINENATAKKGEIIAKNSPVKYVAPFEAEQIKILVEEGSFVQKGDTLVYLKNESVDAAYQQVYHELSAAMENVDIYAAVRINLKNKLAQLRKGKGTLKGKYDLAVKDNSFEQYSREKEFKAVREEYQLLNQNLKIDSSLLADGVINKRKYDETFQAFLNTEQKFIQYRKLERQGINNESNLRLQYTQDLTAESLRELDTEKELLQTEQLLKEFQVRVNALQNKLKFQDGELSKRHLIAEFDGHVKFLYSEKLESNVVPKGADLLILSPKREEQFYAKLEVAQKDIKMVEVGQSVHLKLTAYDAFKYGIIKGKVSYISESDMENRFFVLVNLQNTKENFRLKNGFFTEADIILKKVKLYDYLFKKLFFQGAAYFEEPREIQKAETN